MVEAVKTAAAKSWKTTAAGFLSGLGILCHQAVALLDDNAATVVSFEAVMLALGLMGVGMFARDNNVTSEQAGAAKPAGPS